MVPASRRVRVRLALVPWLLLALNVAGCHPAPPRPGDGGAVVIATDPVDGAAAVSRMLAIRVYYDRPLSPRALVGGAVLLRSGDRAISIRVAVDPAAQSLEARPETMLDPEIDYRLEVAGLEDLDGFMGEPTVVHFSTGLDATPAPEDRASWRDVEEIFAPSDPLTPGCRDCHGGAAPLMGLDLSSAAGVRSTAIGVPAREVAASGEAGAMAQGLVGLPRIEPGRPDRSYLVYKILGDPHILGARMPFERAPLDPEDIATMVRWIRAGAPTE